METTTSFEEVYRQKIPDSADQYEKSFFDEAPSWEEVKAEDDISRQLEMVSQYSDDHKSESSDHMRYLVHEELGYTTDEVKILDRMDGAGVDYSAVMWKDSNGNWKKDLSEAGATEGSYLRYDEEADTNKSAEVNLRDLWKEPMNLSALTFTPASEQHIYDDCLVEGLENPDEDEIGYSHQAEEYISDIADFHENDVFNKEMEVVENATEFYHNQLSEDGYMRIDVTEEEVSEEQYLTEFDDGKTLYATET